MFFYNKNLQQRLLEDILSIYDLNLDPQKEFHSLYVIAEYVYEECSCLIPDEIKDMVRINSDLVAFESEILSSLIINAAIVQLEEKHGSVTRNGALLGRVGEYLEKEVSNRTIVDMYRGKELADMAERHFTTLAEELCLNDDNNKYSIPVVAAPFASYIAASYDIHKVLNEISYSVHSKSFMEECTNKYKETFHIHYLNSYLKFLDDFVRIPNITKAFGIKKYNGIYDKEVPFFYSVNRILFEREYNLQLASQIYMETKNNSIFKSEYSDLLCILSLFPNLFGRIEYVRWLSKNIKDKKKTYILDDVFVALLGFSLITIPIMESYFLYLQRKFYSESEIIDIDIYLEDSIRAYLSDNENSDRPCLNKLFADQGNNEVTYSQIKNTLYHMNKVKRLYKAELFKIYIDPVNFLYKNDYDPLTSILLVDSNDKKAFVKTIGKIALKNIRDKLND